MSLGAMPEKCGVTTTGDATHTQKQADCIYPFKDLPLWDNGGMCQGTPMLTVEGLPGRGEIFRIALGKGSLAS